MGHPAFGVAGYATTHSLTFLTTDAGASTSISTAPSLYFRERIRALASSMANILPFFLRDAQLHAADGDLPRSSRRFGQQLFESCAFCR